MRSNRNLIAITKSSYVLMRRIKINKLRERRATGNESGENPWRLGGLTVWQLAKRVFDGYNRHDISAWATFLAFAFLLSIFPAFIVIAATGAYLNVTPSQVLALVGRFAPKEAIGLLQGSLNEVLKFKSAGLLSLGAFLAIWSASSGILAVTRALNHAYEVREDRGFFRLRLTALFLLFTAGSIVFSNLLLITLGHLVSDWLSANVPGGFVWALLWDVARWVVQVLLAFLMMSLLYYFAPAASKRWEWISPGSLVAVVLWLLISVAFSLYVQNVGSYSKAYGSLGAVIVLMLWFQYTGLAILIGGEINAQIEKAARERSRRQQRPQDDERLIEEG